MSNESRRRPTMDDLAEAAGVSRALVSLVMRGSPKVSAKSREKVLKAAAEMDYRLNAAARDLASKRTHTLGVLLNELHNQFYTEIMDGVEEGAATSDYRTLIGTAGRRANGERLSIGTFLEMRVDGLILVGPRLPTADILAAASFVPTLVVARNIRSDLVDTIVNDERAGALLVIRHLASLGHRRIWHIDGGNGAGAAVRRDSYRRAMSRFGLSDEVVILPGDYTDLAGVRAVDDCLRRDNLPTAIFAANDFVAAGALARLEDFGYKVPDDISLIGYDNTSLAAMHHMNLTTVNQPRREMGRLAAQRIIQTIEQGREATLHKLVIPKLVIRGTTAPPATNERRSRATRGREPLSLTRGHEGGGGYSR